ncbi:MAG: hypothetical protein ACM3XN_00195 [Chloroflexota bacterium]
MIKNGGGDSLQVSAIGNSASGRFRVVSPLPDYSRFLGANQQMTGTVAFAPVAVTAQPVEETLTVGAFADAYMAIFADGEALPALAKATGRDLRQGGPGTRAGGDGAARPAEAV